MSTIIHIADIHIGSGIPSDDMRFVFDNLAKYVNCVNPTCVVICGDIFHHKTRYSGEDVSNFNYLMDILSHVHVIIIPGNHDVNMNRFSTDDVDSKSIDLITPLISGYRNNVKYLYNTCEYNFNHLQFFHISVTDTRGREELLQLTSVPAMKEKILLYHGMVDGCEFGKFKETNTRISVQLMKNFSCVMLGDVHASQFIYDNVAYSGSLMQQNLGEGLSKGLIVWISNEGGWLGKFVPIKANYGFLKIDTRGKSTEECRRIISSAGDNVRKISLIFDDSDSNSKCVSNLKTDSTVGGLISRVTLMKSLKTVIDPVESLSANMALFLKGKVSPEIAREVIELYAGKITSYACSRWSINKLCWSNLFKYGDGNIINFDKLSGPTGVIAPNRAGKSSIIDIIVFALYNVHLRGDNASLVNRTKKDGLVKLYFEVNAIKYYIERKLSSTRSLQVRLYQYDSSSNDCSSNDCSSNDCSSNDDKWKNITGTSVTETYKQMRELIGTIDKFMATGLYYDSIVDVFKMAKNDRMRVLPELFGMIDNEQMIKEISGQRKATAAAINELVKPRFDPSARIVQLREETAVDLIGPLKEQLRTVEAEISEQLSVCIGDMSATVKGRLSNEKAALIRLVYPSEVPAAPECSKVIVSVRQSEISLLDIPADIPEIVHQRVDDPSNAIAALTRELSTLQSIKQVVQPTTDVASLRNQLSELSVELRKIVFKKDFQPRKPGDYSFNDACDCCKQNKDLLGVTKYELELAELRAINDHNEVCKERYDEVSSRICDLEKQIKEVDQQNLLYRKYTSACERIVTIQEELNRLNGVKARWLEYLRSRDAAEKRKLRDEIISARDAVAAAERWKLWQAYSAYTAECRRIETLRAVCQSTIDRLTADISIAGKSDEAKRQLTRLRSEEKRLREEINKQNAVRISQLRELEDCVREQAIVDEYNAKLPPLDHQLTLYKTLESTLRSAELKSMVVRSNVIDLINLTNDIVKSVTDFQIELVDDKSIIDFTLIEGKNKINCGLASGFQKFIISIAWRIALASVLPNSCDFMMIDEGFGCVDSLNMERLIGVLPSLVQNMRWCFIISHIPELNAGLSRALMIKNIDGCSCICNDVVSVSSVSSDLSSDLSKDKISKDKISKDKDKNDRDKTPNVIIVEDGKYHCVVCDKMMVKSGKARHEKSKTHIDKVAKLK